MKVCPFCGSATFIVGALESHEWLVDGNGDFIEDRGCYEGRISDATEWECNGCREIMKPITQEDEDDQSSNAEQ